MADDRDDDRPPYTVYRSRPRFLRGRDDAGRAGLGGGERAGDGRPPYEVHRRRRGLRLPFGRAGGPGLPGLPGAGTVTRPRVRPGRVLKWLALAVVAWLGLSLVLFLVSAQIEASRVSDPAKAALSGGGFPLTTPNTILVLGTDARPKGSKEAGATIIGSGGPQRSDTIMLLRVGGGKNAQLSILRDTLVSIPGHGQDKINAAYAFGGPALTIRTVEGYLGIPVNHLVEVNFANFPALVDALGGIDYTGGCVHSELNGGRANGGFTLRLRRGTHHLSGKQALALARTRHNLCAPSEDDRDRAARQQKILSAMKGRVTSPGTFLRLPWVSWTAPKAVQSDMAGPNLLGLVGAELLGGAAHRQVLRPAGFTTLPDGGSAVTVNEADKQAAVQRFLKG
jgi:LCP family protein required for cell wall assembly